MVRKYLVTEDEFKSATITSGGELEFTRDNGEKVNAGVVRGADSTVPGPAGKDGSNVLPTQQAIIQELTEDGPVKTQLEDTIGEEVVSASVRRDTDPGAALHTAFARVRGGGVLFGNSRINYEWAEPFTGHRATGIRGVFGWVNAMTGSRLHVLNDAGIHGNTLAQMIARFATDVAAHAPNWVLFGDSINDAYDGRSGEDMIADTQAILDMIRGIGAVPILVTATPRNSLTTVKRAELAKWNEWVKAQASGAAFVADIAAVVTDPATGDWVDACTTDNIHQSTTGALAAARVLAELLDRVVAPSGNPFPSSPTDPLQIIANPWLAGAVGSALPSGWTASGSAARAVIAQTDGQPGNWVEVTSTAPGNQYLAGSVSPLPASVTPGSSVVELLVEFSSDEWESAASLESRVEFYGLDGATVISGVWALTTSGSPGVLPVGAPLQPGLTAPVVLKSPPLVVPASAVSFKILDKFDGIGKIRWGRHALRVKRP